jgi:aarF domain-containing kinase
LLHLTSRPGLQAALLPKPYRDAFFHVFDNAPSVPYEQVVQVFRSDLGIDPMDVFGEFSKEALASASVAQVHRAVLRPEAGNPDQVVAVKVQKPAIAKQMEWDLFSYKWVFLTVSLLTRTEA